MDDWNRIEVGAAEVLRADGHCGQVFGGLKD